MHIGAFAFAFFIGGVALQSGQSNAPSPFAGTWAANLSRSNLNPNYQIQAASLQFVVAGNTVTITHNTVNTTGQVQRGTDVFQADGEEHQLERSPGVVAVVRWVSVNVLETVAKKDGQIAATATYEVSQDGKTLTAKMVSPGFEQVVVFERK